MNASAIPKREFLRHTLATLAYRGGKTVRETSAGFGTERIGERTRTPVEILAHIDDLLEWALSIAKGVPAWKDSMPLFWDQEVIRFFSSLRELDAYLVSDAPLGSSAEGLFQGPIADALTHIGQIAMLRRLAGSPVRGESYFKAEIVVGRVGPEQSLARKEFE